MGTIFFFLWRQTHTTITSESYIYTHWIVSVISNVNCKWMSQLGNWTWCFVSLICHAGSSTERKAVKHGNYENNEPHRGLGGALLKVPEQHVVFSQRYQTLPITHGLPQYTAGDMREDTDNGRPQIQTCACIQCNVSLFNVNESMMLFAYVWRMLI